MLRGHFMAVKVEKLSRIATNYPVYFSVANSISKEMKSPTQELLRKEIKRIEIINY